MDKIIGALSGDKDQEGSSGAFPFAGNLLSLLDDDDEKNNAADDASRRAGSSGNTDMFKSILGSLSSNKAQVEQEDLDEEDAIRKHKKYVVDDDDDQADAKGLGTAAAMQALKLFNSGEGSSSKGSSTKETMFLSLAMSEASKLFDQKASSGKLASGTQKESVVQQAGQMALKMYLKSQLDSQGSSSGGASGLLSMASKFMK